MFEDVCELDIGNFSADRETITVDTKDIEEVLENHGTEIFCLL